MNETTKNVLCLTLLGVGAAGAIYYVAKKRNAIGTTATVKIRRGAQANRDRNLGGVAPNKWFGFRGRSSAQGAGTGAGINRRISQAGTPGTIRGQIPGNGGVKSSVRPSRNGYPNGKHTRASIAAAIVT